LFAIPFKLSPQQPGISRELDLFGGVAFKLARWDPLYDPANAQNDPDPYAYFSSSGTQSDAAATFTPTRSGLPLTYDTARPTSTTYRPLWSRSGLGYWLDLSETQQLNISGETVNNPVGIRLFAENGTRNPGGWNLIGTPFTFPVDFNSVSVLYRGTSYRLEEAVAQNIVKGALVGYSQGDYFFQIAPQGQFQPFNGYWIRALQDCVLIVPPAASSLTRSVSVSRRCCHGATGGNDGRSDRWPSWLAGTSSSSRCGRPGRSELLRPGAGGERGRRQVGYLQAAFRRRAHLPALPESCHGGRQRACDGVLNCERVCLRRTRPAQHERGMDGRRHDRPAECPRDAVVGRLGNGSAFCPFIAD
jgi:hypothetical protein